MKLTVITALAVLATMPDPAIGTAQERLQPGIVAGSRVRFVRDVERRRREGVVMSRDDSTLLVRQTPGDTTVRAVLDSLRELTVGTPRSVAAGAAHGALVGFAVGAVLTAVVTTGVWLSNADERCNDCWLSATGTSLVVGTLASGVLTIGGAMIGASARGFTWRQVARASSVSPTGISPQLGLRFAWR